MTNPMEDQAKRLREARERAGYESARKAALAHGWGVSTYAAHENGQNAYNAEKAEMYAKAFKTRADWLMFGVVDADSASPGVDAQLRALPKELSRPLLARFQAMIEGVKLVGKVK